MPVCVSQFDAVVTQTALESSVIALSEGQPQKAFEAIMEQTGSIREDNAEQKLIALF